MVVIKNQIVPAKYANKVTSSGTNTRQYITIHETGNNSKGANAQSHAKLQSNGNARAASWHITVDDKEAIRSFHDASICWHSGARYPKLSGNPRSIGIEICVNSDGNYKKTIDNAAAVVASLMKEHGIPIDRVVQHNHWSGKNCPQHLRQNDWGVSWSQFKSKVAASSGNVGTAASPSTPDYSLDGTVLQYGDSNKYVTLLQKDLNTIGIPVGVDGQFGNELKTAVMLFQQRKGLTKDGIAGPGTQAALAVTLKEHAETVVQPIKPSVAKPSAPSKGESVMDELYKPSAQAMVDSTVRVLNRLERKEVDAIDPMWREKAINGTLTVSDAVAILFVAFDRQLFD